MNDETERAILAELQRKRRFDQLSLILAPVVIAVVLGVLILTDILRDRRQAAPSAVPSWNEVSAARCREDIEEALRIATILRDKCPTDAYAESWLGNLYQAKGDLINAEKHFARAVALLPDEQYEKELAAVRKALVAKDGANPTSEGIRQPADGSPKPSM
jgi:tetratricopeptide (TPR) repeat protein